MPRDNERQLSRRTFVTAVAGGSVVLAGCSGGGGDGSGDGSDGSSGDGSGDGSGGGSGDGSGGMEMADSLEIWSFGTLPPAFEVLGEAYNDARGADVQFETPNLGYGENHNQYQTAIAGGQGAPGLGTYESRWTPDLLGTGGLVDLEDRIPDDTVDAVVDWTWDAVSDDEGNGRYGVPFDIAPVATFYNRNLYDEIGITPDDVETYGDFIEYGSELPDDVHMLTFGTGVLEWQWEMLVRQQGGQAYTEDGALMLDTRETIRAAEVVKELFDTGTAVDVEEFTESWVTGLQEERIATVTSGAWMAGALVGTVPDMEGDWGIHRPPALDPGGNRASNHGGSNLVIAAQLDEPVRARAWDFLKFALTNEEQVLTLATEAGIFPAHSGVYGDPYFSQEQAFFGGDSYDIFLELAEEIPAMRMITDHREVYERMGDFFADLVAGDYGSAAEMAADAESTIASEVGRDVA